MEYNQSGLPHIPTAKERLADLAKTAEYPLDVSVHPNRYLASSKPLYETARYEASHGNFQKAYVLLIRYLDLLVQRLPRHPKYGEAKEELKNAAKKNLKTAITLAEEVKAKVLRELEEDVVYETKMAQEEESRRQQAIAAQSRSGAPFDKRAVDGIIHNISAVNGMAASAPPEYDGALQMSWPQAPGFYTMPPVPGDQQFVDGKPTIPSFDRSLKPLAPPRGSRTRVGPPISPVGICRPVHIPGDLVDKFVDTARENTEKRNIETCGHLYGNRNDEGHYVVTHLLIPKQKGTDSYCEDLDELSEVATYAISRDLMQLGWIHTHPTQSAFLSSVDLHMQWGYQMMLPEAVAIVVAPAYNDVAVFRLDDFGMQYIGECEHGTNFHSHDTSQLLFQRVDNVVTDGQLSVKMEDFRVR